MIPSRLAHLCVPLGRFAPVRQRLTRMLCHGPSRHSEAINKTSRIAFERARAVVARSSRNDSCWHQHLHVGPALSRQLHASSQNSGSHDFLTARWSWLGFAAAAAGVAYDGGWLAHGDSRAGPQQQQLQQQQHQQVSTSIGSSSQSQHKVSSLQQLSSTDDDLESANTSISGSGLLSDVIRQLADWYSRAEAWLTAILQQSSDEHVFVKLLALSLAVLPVIVASGVMYTWASGVPISQALYKMYCLLYRVEAGHEPNLASYLVTNAVFMLGFFTLALLLGVVNDEVQRRADDARMGRNPVYCKDHVLLLNWNSNSPALLHNIATAIAAAAAEPAAAGRSSGYSRVWSRDPTVVVLADVDKSQMDVAVQEAVRDRGLPLNIHTRQGNPFKLSHLKKVSAPQASVVILLHPDTAGSADDAEAMKAAAAMSFTTLSAQTQPSRKQDHQRRMIVQMPSSVPAGGNVLRSLLRQSASGHGPGTSGIGNELELQVLSMPDDALVNRMVAQTAAQPGVSTCWQDVLSTSAGTSQLHCMLLPTHLQGQSYRDIRRSFPDAVVCGYTGIDGSVHLNPAESAVPKPGSSLVLLTKYGAAAQASKSSHFEYETAGQAAAHRLNGDSTYRPKASTIVVAGWSDGDIPDLMRSFSDFTPAGSSVTFITQQQQVQEPSASSKQGNCSFRFITHPYPTSIEALVLAGLQSADSIVLGSGSADTPDAEADARVLAGLLQVQEAVLQGELPAAPHVVAPIRSSSSSAMAIQYLQDLSLRLSNVRKRATASGAETEVSKASPASVVQPEFLMFRDVTSAVLAQVVSEPAYADIITHLMFSGEGQEMYLRSPAQFNIPTGTAVPFAEVAELARQTKQTALGCIHASQAGVAVAVAAKDSNSSSGGSKALSSAALVRLGLGAADEITFNKGDCIVVLARDFVV